MKVVVVDADYPDIAVEREVLAGCTVVRADARDPGAVAEAARGADALIYQWARITAEVFDAAPSVGLVVRYGVGTDSVDLDAAAARGIWVANVPDYGAEEVAAHTAAGLLACARRLKPHDALLASGTWDYLAAGPIRRISELTLGCLGLGRIGRTLVSRVGAWFGTVVAHDPHVPHEEWPRDVERVDLDALFARSDLLSLHLPLTDSTRHIADARRLSLLPQGACLVNTARGGLVDERALVELLDSGRLACAALDVWAEEPSGPAHPLVGHPRVIATPHVAWFSQESEVEVRRRAAENVLSWISSGAPDHAVVTGTRTAPVHRY
ncbi:C-terminal binding protein [Allokutzneria sp. A3M-2-11 16]|uniref:C-terminal binding protein n=1 Tax=Allokutzneria sp. A3M-2-11 16 TaxID=2962043 RepID=UPI0020B83CB1|nr:C-terminal binding protein [Allokutzneria sp. A3M-2-11 16]MCP3804848.1 C-terminal binding protein [Allokutzneria sp. A3M-2-11 16]